MKVECSEAVRVLKAMDVHTADSMGNPRLSRKLEALPDMNGLDKKVREIKDKELKNLVNAILAAIEEGKSIMVVDDSDDESPKKKVKTGDNGKAKKGAKAKDEDDDEEDDEDEEEPDEEPEEEDLEEEEDEGEESEDEESDEDESEDDEDEEEDEESESEDEEEEEVAPKKKVKAGVNGKGKKDKGEVAVKEKPKKKAAKAEVEVDVFGNRTGTRTSRINKAIWEAKGPLTAKQIEDKAKASSIHSHLYKLATRKFIKKTDDGRYVKTGKKA